jgi:hypothetical protein
VVKSPKQAIAISLSEAKIAKKKWLIRNNPSIEVLALS